MVHFTIGVSSGRQGSRTLISVGRTTLAEGPGQPYPATFQVDPPGIEPGSPACRAGVVPLDHGPIHRVDRMGIEPNAPTLQGSVAPLEHASPFSFFIAFALRSVATGDRARLLVPGVGIEPTDS